jgi:hypothetical protein
MYFDDSLTLSYCSDKFGQYAFFATVPLQIALLGQDVFSYDMISIRFSYSGVDHADNPTLRDFMNNLVYDDSSFFTTDEMRFYLSLGTRGGSVSDEKLEADRQRLLREAEGGCLIGSVNAKYLLKAIDYWKLRYNEKRSEWAEMFRIASHAQGLRALLKEGVISQREFETGVIVKDEGYCSDFYSEEDE